MSNSTLFAHLAVRFGAQPENLATEALGYLLRESATASGAVARFVGQLGRSLPGALTFQNQHTDTVDDGRPDLVGVAPDGSQPLIIEAKFWASLTNHQPVTYLKRLPSTGGILLFIVPELRIDLIWSEVRRRSQDAGLSFDETTSSAGLRQAAVAERQFVQITSWRALLDSLGLALSASGEHIAASDLRQLQGLCARMDAEAFLPVQPEELTSGVYRRVLDFSNLIDDVANRAVEQGFCSKDGLKSTASLGMYGRYLSASGCGVLLQVDIHEWTTRRATPLWLRVWGYGWKDTQGACEALASLGREHPPRLFRLEHKGRGLIPLRVLTGVERDEVIDDLVDQLRTIADLLESAQKVDPPSPTPSLYPSSNQVGAPPSLSRDEARSNARIDAVLQKGVTTASLQNRQTSLSP